MVDLNVSRNESSKFSKIHGGAAAAAAEEWHLIISTCTTQKIVRCRTVDLSSVAWAEEGDCVRVDWLGNLICLRGCVLPIFFWFLPLQLNEVEKKLFETEERADMAEVKVS